MARRKSAMDVLNQRNRMLGQIKKSGETSSGARKSQLASRFKRVDAASKKYVKNMTGRTVLNSFTLNTRVGNIKMSRAARMGLSNG